MGWGELGGRVKMAGTGLEMRGMLACLLKEASGRGVGHGLTWGEGRRVQQGCSGVEITLVCPWWGQAEPQIATQSWLWGWDLWLSALQDFREEQ